MIKSLPLNPTAHRLIVGAVLKSYPEPYTMGHWRLILRTVVGSRIDICPVNKDRIWYKIDNNGEITSLDRDPYSGVVMDDGLGDFAIFFLTHLKDISDKLDKDKSNE